MSKDTIVKEIILHLSAVKQGFKTKNLIRKHRNRNILSDSLSSRQIIMESFYMPIRNVPLNISTIFTS